MYCFIEYKLIYNLMYLIHTHIYKERQRGRSQGSEENVWEKIVFEISPCWICEILSKKVNERET